MSDTVELARERLNYFKGLLEKHFVINKMEEIFPDILIDGKIRCGIGANSNPYLLYDYVLWFWEPGRGKSIPFKEDYHNEEMIVRFCKETMFENKVECKCAEIETRNEVKKEEPKAEKTEPLTLFDFM